MQKTQFVYVTYIRTTAKKLWDALMKPEFTERYWLQTRHESEWKPGSPWRAVTPDGHAKVTGDILEVEPHRRLVFTWRSESKPELKAEGNSRVTYTIEPQGESVKLTVLHEMEKSAINLLEGVSRGWPLVLASLKSMLETGEPLAETRKFVPCG